MNARQIVRIMRPTQLAALALVVGACSADRDPGELFGPEESGLLVVDAVLIVGQPLPELFVRRTQSPSRSYSPKAAAVTEARVVISQGEDRFEYTADADSAGRYVPVGTAAVRPETRYDLVVEAGGDRVDATTVTPGQLRIRAARLLDEASLAVRRDLALYGADGDPLEVGRNAVIYQDGLLELEAEEVAAAAYQLALFSLDPTSDFVISADFLEEDDYEDFERQGSSPPLFLEDGRVRLPWFAVAFAGPHVFRLYAIDRNWFDYARTNPDDGFQAGGLIGDSFERPAFRLEGAIGLFGSASVDSLGFTVLPRLTD